jgi:hypothetical protein
MLKIWGRRNSSNVRKVLWCAEEIGLPYESIEVGGSHGGTQTPEYQAMNPNGLVPVIEDRPAAVGIERHRALPERALRAGHAVRRRPDGARPGREVDGLEHLAHGAAVPT